MEVSEDILLKEAPIYLPTIEFGLPGYLQQRGWTTERTLHPKVVSFRMLPVSSPEQVQEFFRKYDAESFTVNDELNPARLMFGALTDAIKERITDRDVLQGINSEFNKILKIEEGKLKLVG